MSQKTKTIFIILLVLFVLIRLPGLNLPFHQDEWKTVRGVELGAITSAGLFHPPLTQLLFRAGNFLFGGAHLRALPFLFSILSAILLFAIVKKRMGEWAALLALFLFTVSFYSIWASLMIDTDGAVLPAFFLLTVYSYDRRHWWLMASALLLGLMVKLSFVLVVGVLFLDFLFGHYQTITRRQFFWLFSGVTGLFGFSVLMVWLIHLFYPVFSISGMVEHARSFAHLSGRNYLQIIVQSIKALYYLSPVLTLPLILVSKETFKETRLFFVYLLLGFIFYFVIFDFSRGALDKYLMFAVVPLCVISGRILSRFLNRPDSLKRPGLIVTSILLFVISSSLNFFPQTLISLYPKTEWFNQVIHGKFNILTPFTGGSGPLGFYISFLFILVSFILSLLIILLICRQTKWRSSLVVLVLVLSLSYNSVFAEELFWGKVNGGAPRVLTAAISFISQNKKIKQIITYNDIGAYDLDHLGKYAGRFYAVPEFESDHQKKFAAYSGHYLVVNIPPLYNGFYSDFFAKCDILFSTTDQKITAQVYACHPKIFQSRN